MKEINLINAESVSGGHPVLAGIAIGVGGSYVYDSMGGREGINNYLKNSWASMRASINYWF